MTTAPIPAAYPSSSDGRPGFSLFSDAGPMDRSIYTYEVTPTDRGAIQPEEKPVPLFQIRRFANMWADKASVKVCDDGSLFMSVEDLPGVWAEGRTLGEAVTELREVIADWAMVKMDDGDELPCINGINLNAL